MCNLPKILINKQIPILYGSFPRFFQIFWLFSSFPVTFQGKDEDAFIMVRVDQAAPSTSSPGQSDFVLVQVEMDEPKQLPRPKVEVKDEDWDDDW